MKLHFLTDTLRWVPERWSLFGAKPFTGNNVSKAIISSKISKQNVVQDKPSTEKTKEKPTRKRMSGPSRASERVIAAAETGEHVSERRESSNKHPRKRLQEDKRSSVRQATAASDDNASLQSDVLTSITTKRESSRRRRTRRNNLAPLRDPFLSYMDEISQSDILDQKSVIELADRIKEGVNVEKSQARLIVEYGRKPSILELADRLESTPDVVQRKLNLGLVAKNDLVAANLRLVTSIARKVQSSKTSTQGLALDDMIQEGNVGLIRAAEKYDVTRGYRFSTYATWWVRASIMRAVTTQSRTIKVPTTVVEEYLQIEKERSRLVAEGKPNPTDSQIATNLGITTAKLRFISKVVSKPPVSLDLPVADGDTTQQGRTLGELVVGDDEIEERLVVQMQKQELDSVLRRSLKPVERAAVRLRFGLEDGHPRTLREVGQLLSISRERARQHIFSALSKLRTPEVRQFLVNYLS